MTNDAQTEVWDLIPWYVNGTLEPAERDQVEAEMARSDEVAAEVALQRRMQRAVANIDVAAHQTEQSWSALETRLTQRRRWSWPKISRPNFFVVPVAITALISVAMLGVIQPWSPSEFETLTTENPATAPAQANLRISPVAGASTADIRAALAKAGVQQIGPISETGLIYGYAEPRDLQALAQALQEDPAIAFVAGDF